MIAQIYEATLRFIFIAMFRRQFRQDLIALFAQRIQQLCAQIVFDDRVALRGQCVAVFCDVHLNDSAKCFCQDRDALLGAIAVSAIALENHLVMYSTRVIAEPTTTESAP